MPGQAALAPATQLASLTVGVNIAFETFKNVVSLDSQARGTLGRRNRTHTAAA